MCSYLCLHTNRLALSVLLCSLVKKVQVRATTKFSRLAQYNSLKSPATSSEFNSVNQFDLNEPPVRFATLKGLTSYDMYTRVISAIFHLDGLQLDEFVEHICPLIVILNKFQVIFKNFSL